MHPQDIENIERATVAAVAPEAVEELDGWLLPCDSGTVSRAHSAVPLQHAVRDTAAVETLIDTIEAHYRARGQRAVFRLARRACFDPLRAALQRRAYATDQPVQVQVAELAQVSLFAQTANSRAPSFAAPATVDTHADAAWAALFLGAGFDPVDGARRVRSLGRARGSVYASVRENGHTIAVGSMAFSHGWCSVHGVRTDLSRRGQGLAGRVLAGLAETARQRGFQRVFLQVEAHNSAALALYRRAGFSAVWSYDYWRPPRL